MVRVGITGHRWDKLDHQNEASLQAQVRSVLTAVQGIAARLGNLPHSGYRSPDASAGDEPVVPEIRLISPLAEGSDRIFVDGAPPGCTLQAILPFPVEVYQKDFTEPRSAERLAEYLARARGEAGVLVLDGDRNASNAFEPVGTAVCLNSDLLIAIWDGLPGKRGGTAEVVELAKRVGLPTVRITPDGARAEGVQELEPALERLFLPPVLANDADDEERHQWERQDLRELYFRERHKPWQRGQTYAFMLRLLAFNFRHAGRWWRELRRAGLPKPKRNPEHYGEAVRARWTHKWKRDLGIAGECVDGLLDSRLPEHYGWASTLANYYAGRYRNSFFLGYLLSSIAVGFGAAGGLVTSALLLWVPNSSLVTAGTELVILLAILTVVWTARRQRFHERWLAYRSLTEGFRSLTYTLPLARASTLSARGDAGEESWTDWLHRAVVREVGLPSASLTPAHLAEARKLLVNDILPEQIDYHARNAATQSAVDRRLHRWTRWFFLIAILIAAFHTYDAVKDMASEEGGIVLKRLMLGLSVLGVTIPAAAAAMHGFLSQGEFEATADRSRRAKRTLARLKAEGEQAPLTSAALGELAAETAAAMQSELGAWFAAYAGKGVNYP